MELLREKEMREGLEKQLAEEHKSKGNRYMYNINAVVNFGFLLKI